MTTSTSSASPSRGSRSRIGTCRRGPQSKRLTVRTSRVTASRCDGMMPDELKSLVRGAIEQHVDSHRLAVLLEYEHSEREQIESDRDDGRRGPRCLLTPSKPRSSSFRTTYSRPGCGR